jgi:hypothetical protein
VLPALLPVDEPVVPAVLPLPVLAAPVPLLPEEPVLPEAPVDPDPVSVVTVEPGTVPDTVVVVDVLSLVVDVVVGVEEVVVVVDPGVALVPELL